MSLQPSTRLGPYEIISSIGAGGMGEVYRAKDTRLDRTVAVKVLPEHLSSNPQLRQRFEREAKAISSLSHPHICSLYDIGHQDGVDFLVMEYLEGETLAGRLRKGPLPPDQVLQFAIQITDALDTAHQHGVIHRDLKPSNIMLTKSGAKLLDFGLAKVRAAEGVAGMTALPTQTAPLTGEKLLVFGLAMVRAAEGVAGMTALPTQTAPLTGEGTILGTLQYMAPEQLEGAEADARTDIFALGAVIYEMATGRKAFEGKSQASLISAIMTSEPPPISSLQTMAPAALDHVVRICLTKQPGARWQTAHDILIDLKWLAHEGSQAAASKPVVAQRTRRELLLSAMLVSVLVALLVVTVAYFHHKPPEARPIRFSIFPPAKVTFAPLYLSGPALISPDGSRLAFVGVDDAGKRQLWERPLDALAAQPLAETAGFEYPFWSPDSRYLAFFAEGKLKRVSAGGGAPQIVCDAPSGRGGSWAPAKDGGPGTIVFAPDRFVALSRVSAAGGEPVQVTTLDSSRQQSSHRQPEFLPDGRHFLYAARDKAEKSGIFIGDLQAKPDPRTARLLMGGVVRASYAPPGYLLFVRDDNLMAQPFNAQTLELSGENVVLAEKVAAENSVNTTDFSVSANAVLAWRTQSGAEIRQLAWFDRSGKPIEGLDLRELYGDPKLSPDGNRIAVSRGYATQPEVRNIWLLDLVRGSASRLTFGTGAQERPIWSPDGRRIAFRLYRPSEFGLYWKDSSGASNEEQLLKSSEDMVPTDWSRDGRFILFDQIDVRKSKPQRDLWVLPLAGGRKPMPVLQTEFDEGDGQFSPDGHWIAYSSNESGRYEVYVRPFTEDGASVRAGKWPVSTAGGEQPQWRRDGKELFYRAGSMLMAVPVEAASTFTAGVPVTLFDTRDPDLGYDVRSDGHRFLISRVFERGVPGAVNVCMNWLAGMKK